MSNLLKVYCKNIGEYIPFEGGMTLMDIYKGIADRIEGTPICAQVNNRTEDMQFPLFSPGNRCFFLPRKVRRDIVCMYALSA